ncbi:hypothetical protein EN817_00580 [Mesorhizobium sp. M3A.F.Ca.ET.174.01.1.1]|nr:hypothetical protein EJ074_28575 [Mesorhizobium sp. M3A.F.Ca.ET.080.04.2.1]PBB87307.1 hypothetical protein CK216_09775 [Mesorhizobium sp. WSM3876]RWB71443.1 MAG: hypothetical protein EOQ49_15855 [Mesorhizobium sp.]TGS68557.1 hypothetical protein EN844_13195 [Mesorhizobium sp. M3A.F.Ca.ET.201.01.1.1]TGS89639.1 hypothetical protein EN818_00580 [Mesorhizobium sp. M3A.F.Ca.ET.175.01.1.1]TGT31412.1 hypothetical protein EN817_00580 [Mesorhizobium sp. M3A.F.Ca.ET.174.01.1.1]TGT59739.1 hypothetica
MLSRSSFYRMAVICGMFAISVVGNGLDIPAAQAKAVVIQKTTIYITTLPKGCVKTTYSGGIVVWKCGTKYYQPYKGRFVLVYIK